MSTVILPEVGQTRRRRLPNRRPAITEAISFVRGNGEVVEYLATAGFDEAGRVKEIFLSGAKAGADMSSFLADAGVILSVGLQSGISAKAFGVSVARVPQSDGSSLPGSAIARGGRFSGEPGGRRIVTGALRKWTGNTGPPPKRRTRPGGGALGSKAVAITRHAINGRPRQKSKVPQTGAGR